MQRGGVNQGVLRRCCAHHARLMLWSRLGRQSTSEVLWGLYKQLQADQMNKVLYILTVVTTVFIPAQFFTGALPSAVKHCCV